MGLRDPNVNRAFGVLTEAFLNIFPTNKDTGKKGVDLTTPELIDTIHNSPVGQRGALTQYNQKPQISSNFKVGSDLKFGEITSIFNAPPSISTRSCSFRGEAAP